MNIILEFSKSTMFKNTSDRLTDIYKMLLLCYIHNNAAGFPNTWDV